MEFGTITKILITRDQIKEKVETLGKQITEDYKNTLITCVAILKGSFIFASDLIREIKSPLTIDFMVLSSYGGSTTSSGNLKLYLDLRQDIKDKHVLIIEDIIDSGYTMVELIKMFKSREPASIKICSLLRKDPQDTPVEIDYHGFSVDKSDFVVGYGLDYAEHHRELPDIGILSFDKP